LTFEYLFLLNVCLILVFGWSRAKPDHGLGTPDHDY
jgi:hypothetical protein